MFIFPEANPSISERIFFPILSINEKLKSFKFKSKSMLGFSLIAITDPLPSRLVLSFERLMSIAYELKSVFPERFIFSSPK